VSYELSAFRIAQRRLIGSTGFSTPCAEDTSVERPGRGVRGYIANDFPLRASLLLDSLGEPAVSLDGRGIDLMDKQLELLQGTLEMLILKAVSLSPLHGYGVLLRIQQISKDRLEIQQGSLYPALYRLEHQGWITGEWGESENNRRARYYRLTAAGKRRLQSETKRWNEMTAVIAGILQATPEEL